MFDRATAQSIRIEQRGRFTDGKSGHEMKWSAGEIMTEAGYSSTSGKYNSTTEGEGNSELLLSYIQE